MFYYAVKFLKKDSTEAFSSDKEYIYKTDKILKNGSILISFKRKDKMVPYSSSAKVIRLVDGQEAEMNTPCEIQEIEILKMKEPDTLLICCDTDVGSYFTPTYSNYLGLNSIAGGVNVGTCNSLTYEEIDKIVDNHMKKYTKEEEKNMNVNSMFKNMNFEFGKVKDNTIAYSIKGMAVGTNVGTAQESYKTYDGDVVDVTGLVFKDIPLYKMPVAIKDITEDDMVIHQKKPVIVEVINDDGTLLVVDVASASEITIFPVKNIFGFNFYTKIVNPFSPIMGGATPDNPFGNMLLLMMLSEGEDGNDMLPMLMMMNGGMANMNSILPFLMMSDSKGDMKDMALMMMLMGDNFLKPTEK